MKNSNSATLEKLKCFHIFFPFPKGYNAEQGGEVIENFCRWLSWMLSKLLCSASQRWFQNISLSPSTLFLVILRQFTLSFQRQKQQHITLVVQVLTPNEASTFPDQCTSYCIHPQVTCETFRWSEQVSNVQPSVQLWPKVLHIKHLHKNKEHSSFVF